ncbi:MULTISPECIES: ABC transporter substrate-binding protein [unclassified Brenneria]|uniref:ABC transporter substrate-binding protein n=1 Tax=unclassified Brenneria TaxID=2634434 RepID=UPI0029C18158|nr:MULTISPECIES: ABC transporter substrate-binding protein [unclassified Brenneria]MDX5628026.1 ABC transporter substrate-binding protein [Brenneria sp. L3-3Z]MDX5694954.1 ABC transporter substrate-binding protein [Brenneria sp. L4-2C]
MIKLNTITAALVFSGAIGTAVHAATPPDSLVMAWNIDAISTWDPAQIGEVVTNEIVLNTCDSLVKFDAQDEKKVAPHLAKSWEVSPDHQQITFHLQDNLKFPDGSPATAGDLAWSMQRVVKLGYGNAAAITEYGFSKENVDQTIVAPDDKTLILKLDKPYPTNLVLQAIAANVVSTLQNRKLLEKEAVNGDFGHKYLSTRTACVGPYQLVRWNAGEGVVLQATEHYWSTPPALKRVLIRHVAETGTQRLLLTQGDVDVARDLSADDLKTLDEGGRVNVVKVLKPQLFFWTFNNEDPIFKNEKVRLAMRYLIDYDGLAKNVMPYLGVPRASFAQIGAFGALDEQQGQPFKLDLEKAKQLLSEAGYPNGFSSSVIFGTLPHSAPIAQSIQQNAAKIGVTLKLERMANAQLFSRARGREFASAMMAWQTSVPDAHGNASRLVFNPDNRKEARATQYPSWRAAFYNADLNKQVEAALLEADETRRIEKYAELQRAVMEQGPMAIMFQMYNTAGISPAVKNWTWNGFRVWYNTASK